MKVYTPEKIRDIFDTWQRGLKKSRSKTSRIKRKSLNKLLGDKNYEDFLRH